MGGLAVVAAVVIVFGSGIIVIRRSPTIDPSDAALVAQGEPVYAQHCASCHGVNLEGEPDWQRQKPSGRLPAPPHDASGHTHHHSDDRLFLIIKDGLQTKFGEYETDMPVFGGVLNDQEIIAVLAFIKSKWPPDIQEKQAELTRRIRAGE